MLGWGMLTRRLKCDLADFLTEVWAVNSNGVATEAITAREWGRRLDAECRQGSMLQAILCQAPMVQGAFLPLPLSLLLFVLLNRSFADEQVHPVCQQDDGKLIALLLQLCGVSLCTESVQKMFCMSMFRHHRENSGAVE